MLQEMMVKAYASLRVPFGFKLVGAVHVLLEAEVAFADFAGAAFLFFVGRELAPGVDILLVVDEF